MANPRLKDRADIRGRGRVVYISTEHLQSVMLSERSHYLCNIYCHQFESEPLRTLIRLALENIL